MKTRWNRFLPGVMAAVMAASVLSGSTVIRAEESAPAMQESEQAPGAQAEEYTVASQTEAAVGMPYNTEGQYDVTVDHVIINQVYGGSDDGDASHSFIELYNPCDETVDLNGWELQYQPSADDEDSAGTWQQLALTGTIPAQGYYLIRCGATEDGAYQVPEGDQEWDVQLHNKGVSVALFSQDVTLDNRFAGAVTADNRPEGYVDLLAVQGNDGDDAQMPPVYEGAVSPDQSKKKAVRRAGFADTDDNGTDTEVIDYSETVPEEKGPHNASGETGGLQPEDVPAANPFRNNSFEEAADLTLQRLASVNIGTANADGGVAEIVAYNGDTQTAYVVNGQDGLLYSLQVTAQGLAVSDRLNVRALITGFTYGDMTSVAVDTDHDRIAVALQAADYAANGRVLLLDYDFQVLATYEVGVQPDMVTFTPDGNKVLTANEGEPRQGYGADAVDPEGSVSIVDLEAGTVTNAGFAAFDSESLAAEGVLIGKANGRVNEARVDLEPEYIGVSADSRTAYVTLQEANAIATVDLEAGRVTAVRSLGFQDLSREENAIDLVEDGQYAPTTYDNAVGVYMPDGVSVYEVGGVTYLVTANEGDSREWEGYLNEAEVTLTAEDGTIAEEVRVLDKSCTTVPDESKEYLYGSRSFSIYRADTMEQVYDSGNAFEALTNRYLPDWFNCSNDDIDVDSRSAKKGPEPESVTVGQVGNRLFAFVALERVGGIMVYDVTNPSQASYVNYVNTRDFSGEIAGDVAPEGLAFIAGAESPSGKPMLLAACEVSGTVALYAMDGSAVPEEEPSTEEPSTEAPTQEEPATEEPSTEAPTTAAPSTEESSAAAANPGGGSNPPKTGDTSQILRWTVILVVAAAAVAGILLYQRKQDKGR